MKALLLAGGTGTRLRPLTNSQNKHLMPIANRPVIDYAVDALRDAGLSDIVVVVAPGTGDAIQQHLGDGTRRADGVTFEYVTQPEPLGIAHAIRCAEAAIGDAPFVTYLGDNLFAEGIAPVVDAFRDADAAAAIATQRVADPTPFGVVEFAADGTVAGLVEKPDAPPSDHALVGVYGFTPAVFDVLDDLEPSARGEYEITDAIAGLLARGEPVVHREVDGWWKDTGTPADVLAANRLVLDRDGSEARLTASAVEGATVEHPVALGADVTLADGATVGPYVSIGEGATVRQASIENSIVLPGATVDVDARLCDCLIGRGATVRERDGDGVALVLGRESSVGL